MSATPEPNPKDFYPHWDDYVTAMLHWMRAPQKWYSALARRQSGITRRKRNGTGRIE